MRLVEEIALLLGGIAAETKTAELQEGWANE
jgi:hypothetical protein